MVSSGEDWDRYETLRGELRPGMRRPNRNDPDRPELLDRVARARHEYLTWGRETLGWALYLFGKPAADLR